MPGHRVRLGDQWSTVTRIIRTPAGELRYLLHLDSGSDVEAGHDEVQMVSQYRTLDLLTARGYGSGGYVDVVSAVLRPAQRIAWNAAHPDDQMAVGTTPPMDDLLDALSLISAWREQVDISERELIDAARAAGATWEQIGLILGYTAKGAKQGASQRRKALDERPVTPL